MVAAGSSSPEFGSGVEGEGAEGSARVETEYVRDVLDAVERILGPSLTPELHELFARTAAVNAVKQAGQLIVSASALFIAAVLWGREGEAAPAAVKRLADAVDQDLFDTAFLQGVLDSDYAERLSYLEAPRAATKRARPGLSDTLQDLLERLRRNDAQTVESVVVALLSRPSADLEARLATSRLDARALIRAVQPLQTNQSTRLADDRPQQRRDRLGRGALAIAMAHLVCRIWEDQQPKTGGDDRDAAAFIMHIDAPWGGGKTTFANFLRSILTETDDKQQGRADLAAELGARVAMEDWPAARARAPGGRWPRRAALALGLAQDDGPVSPPWIAATFNAWQNEHIQPSWWNFYLSVRSQLLEPFPDHYRLLEWVEEMVWRVMSRDTLIRIFSLVVLLVALWALFRVVPEIFAENSQSTAPKSLLALVLLALAGGSGIQLLLSLRTGTEWLIRAAGQGGDPQVLGAGDPLRQFKEHFRSFCASLRRPILIVIDDLDRCQPTHVVDLMRGLMTVFNSPQIVYLILGDRAWIEKCYAQAYVEMLADGQDPRTFGGHFAEKSLQLSFLLPSTSQEQIDSYVDALLGAEAGGGAGVAQQREIMDAAKAVARRQSGVQRDAEVRSAMKKVDAIKDKGLRAAATQMVRDATIIGTALSPATEAEIRHHLQDLHALMPNNPRQIKRVINMVALYQASALAVLGYELGGEGWRRMALWVLLAGGYPTIWRALDADPGLADRVRDRADDEEVRRVAAWGRLAGLFDGDLPGKFKGVRLDSAGISDLQRLMPRQESRFGALQG
ncbi:P-loop NTPase fold protein [Paracoccus gahaiensis]|nr:P-loop NTPase fold protein [Paracoccus gahaiensis]